MRAKLEKKSKFPQLSFPRHWQ